MSTANNIRREIDQANLLLTGEDVVESLLENYGWDKAKQFSIIHNSIVADPCSELQLKYVIGSVTGNPLYSIEDVRVWAESY